MSKPADEKLFEEMDDNSREVDALPKDSDLTNGGNDNVVKTPKNDAEDISADDDGDTSRSICGASHKDAPSKNQCPTQEDEREKSKVAVEQGVKPCEDGDAVDVPSSLPDDVTSTEIDDPKVVKYGKDEVPDAASSSSKRKRCRPVKYRKDPCLVEETAVVTAPREKRKRKKIFGFDEEAGKSNDGVAPGNSDEKGPETEPSCGEGSTRILSAQGRPGRRRKVASSLIDMALGGSKAVGNDDGDSSKASNMPEELKQIMQDISEDIETNQPLRVECPLCNKSYVSANILKHVATHGSSRARFRCDECGNTCQSPAALQAHKRCHSGEKPFSCDVCQKIFGTKGNLMTHMRIHERIEGEKEYKCTQCDKSYDSKRYWEFHMKSHEGSFDYICDVCKKTFVHKNAWKSHMKTHSGTKAYICDICGDGLSSSNSLKYHKLIHTGEKPHVCEVCGKSFRDKTTYLRHKTVHSGDRPFKCDICGLTFKWKLYLTRHEMTHGNTRKFTCSICDKQFLRKEHLRTHMRTHTGEKPYVCSYCGAQFSQSCSRGSHEKLHVKKNHRKLSVQELDDILARSKSVVAKSESTQGSSESVAEAEPSSSMSPAEATSAATPATQSCSKEYLAFLNFTIESDDDNHNADDDVEGDDYNENVNGDDNSMKDGTCTKSKEQPSPDLVQEALSASLIHSPITNKTMRDSDVIENPSEPFISSFVRAPSNQPSWTSTLTQYSSQNENLPFNIVGDAVSPNTVGEVEVHTEEVIGQVPGNASDLASSVQRAASEMATSGTKAKFASTGIGNTTGLSHISPIQPDIPSTSKNDDFVYFMIKSENGDAPVIINKAQLQNTGGKTVHVQDAASKPESEVLILIADDASMIPCTYISPSSEIQVVPSVTEDSSPVEPTTIDTSLSSASKLSHTRWDGLSPLSSSEELPYQETDHSLMETGISTLPKVVVRHAESSNSLIQVPMVTTISSKGMFDNQKDMLSDVKYVVMDNSGKNAASSSDAISHVSSFFLLPSSTGASGITEYTEGLGSSYPVLSQCLDIKAEPTEKPQSEGTNVASPDVDLESKLEAAQSLAGMINKPGPQDVTLDTQGTSDTLPVVEGDEVYKANTETTNDENSDVNSQIKVTKEEAFRDLDNPNPKRKDTESAMYTDVIPGVDCDLKSGKCLQCDKVFRNTSYLRHHVLIHKGIETHNMCKVCLKTFPSRGNLRSHLYIHFPDAAKEYECEFCQHKFRLKGALLQHIKIHTRKEGEKDFTCKTCGKGFNSQVHFKNHVEAHRGNYKCICAVCGKSCLSGNALKMHMRSHSDVKDFVCDVCGAGFKTSTTLKKHALIHTDIKEFSCKTCGRAFRDKSTMLRHTVTHSDARPFTCDICGQKFKWKLYMTRHKEDVHGGEANFECKTCLKKFKRKEHLKKHLRVHTGEKPYACKFCPQRFTQTSSCNIHQKSHLKKDLA